jgi:hypothetical protein
VTKPKKLWISHSDPCRERSFSKIWGNLAGRIKVHNDGSADGC